MSTPTYSFCEGKCDSCLKIKQYTEGGCGRELPKIDEEHMIVSHFRLLLGMHKTYESILKKDIETQMKHNAGLTRENKLLNSEVENFKAKNAPKGKAEPEETKIEIDPRNNVEGICEYRVAVNNAIMKCTDPVRYQQKTCGIHMKKN